MLSCWQLDTSHPATKKKHHPGIIRAGILLCFSRRRAFRNQYMVLAIWLACGTGTGGTRAQAVPRPSSTPSKSHRGRDANLPSGQNDLLKNFPCVQRADQFDQRTETRGCGLGLNRLGPVLLTAVIPISSCTTACMQKHGDFGRTIFIIKDIKKTSCKERAAQGT